MGAITSAIALSRGASALGWFFIGALLGPIGIVLAISGTGRRCVDCKRKMHAAARKCPSCGAAVSATREDAPRDLATREGERDWRDFVP